jgi:hypothetical protein
MTGISCRLASTILAATGLALAIASGSHAQVSRQPAATATTAAPAAVAAAAPQKTQAELNAEREQLWDSPDMLRARAWLKDFCSKSAKVTPEMAQAYQKELQSMSTTQLKLWLLKFDEEEEQRQAQYQTFQAANAAGLQQAMAAHKQTQQAYAALNQAQSQAAQNAQGEINEQRAQAQQAQQDKQIEMSTPGPYGGYYGGGTYGPYPYGGYPFGGGGIQYHYHLYH